MPGLGIGAGASFQRSRRHKKDAVLIAATVAPASSPLAAGETLSDTENWALFTDPGNYTTSAPGQSIAGVVVNYTGDTADAATPLAGGDLNSFTVSVTDTGGNARVFTVLPRTVALSAPVASGSLPDQLLLKGSARLTLDASADFTGSSLSYAVTAPAGVSVDAGTGVLTLDPAVMAAQENTPLIVTATNAGGSVQSAFSVTNRTGAVFAVIGQSNAIGRDSFDGGAEHPADTLQLNQSGALVPATIPLDHVNDIAGDMGLDVQFAIDYKAAHPTETVIFVPRARGSTGFRTDDWNPPSDIRYATALADINALLADNDQLVFKGFLWHQGESDVSDDGPYAAALSAMISAFRSNVTGATETTPFVMGELFSNGGARDTVNALIAQVADAFVSCTRAGADGLSTTDNTHFDAASLRILGARYFTQYLAAGTDIAAPPGAVTGLNATPGDAEVTLSWAPPATNGAALEDYNVEVSPDGGVSWSLFADGMSVQTGTTVTGLTNDTAYTFRVSAVNAAGTGPAGVQAVATPVAVAPPPPPPPPPTAVTIVSRDQAAGGTTSGSSADVTWTLDTGPAAPGRRIYAFVSGLMNSAQTRSMTIAGLPAERIGGGEDVEAFFIDSDTTGGPVSFVMSDFAPGTHLQVNCYTLSALNARSQSVITAQSDTGTASGVIDVADGGALVGVAQGASAAGGDNSHTWSGIATTRFSYDIRSGEYVSGADEQDLSAGTGRVISVSDIQGNKLEFLVAALDTAAAPVFSLETISAEPQIIYDGDGSLSVSIGAGLYAGTYTQRSTDNAELTAAMIRAAVTPLLPPAVTGTTASGDVLSGTPGLWIYEGADPGERSYQWKADGTDIPGATELSFTMTTALQGSTVVLEETFDGEQILSTGTTATPPVIPALISRDQVVSTGNSFVTTDVVLTADVGPAQPGRTIYVIAGGLLAGDDPVTLDIAGRPATLLGSEAYSGSNGLRAWKLDDDTLAGAQSLTLSGFVSNHAQIGLSVVSVTGAGSETWLSGTGVSTPASVTASVAEGSALIAAGHNGNGGLTTWTGVTERFDSDIRTSDHFSGGDSQDLAAQSSRTITATNSAAGHQTLGVIVLEP